MGEVGRRGPEGRAPRQVAQAGVSLPLAGVVVQVGDQTDPQRVRAVQAFDYTQVAGRLGQALPETQTPVVHRQGVGVEVA